MAERGPFDGLAPQRRLCRLHRCVPEKELDLLVRHPQHDGGGHGLLAL